MKAPLLLLAVLSVGFSSCSLNKLVMNKVSDALTGYKKDGKPVKNAGSSDAMMADNDPELVAGAVPFAVKMYEMLLEQNPDHQGLILSTGSMFVMYANAFVQGPSEILPPEEYEAKLAATERAGKLYKRGADILEGGLEKKFPGWTEARGNPDQFAALLKKTTKDDVPALYWDSGAVLSAFALNPFDLSLGMRIPEVTAMMNRAYELDPDWGGGTLDEFWLLYYGSLPDGMGGDRAKAEEHYQLALQKAKGLSAGPYVSYAKAMCIPVQDYETYKKCLEAALAIDTENQKENRLVNIINQRKARWLLDNADAYFADTGGDFEYDDEEGDDWP